MSAGSRHQRGHARRRPWRVPLIIALGGLFALAGLRLLLSSDGIRGMVRSLVTRAEPDSPDGQWNPVRPVVADDRLSPEQREKIKRLLSLGYAGGTRPASVASGVTVIDETLASRGLRFFISGHAPEAMLMTRDGEIVHAWRYAYEDLHASRPAVFPPPVSATGCWRRARLLPDGDLLAIYEGHALIKLDRRSRLIWSYAGKCHHDLDLDAGGNIYVLTREADVVPRLHPDDPVLLDYVTLLDHDGVFQRKIPLLEAFENSPYAGLLPKPGVSGDIFHTNTLELLDGRLVDRSPAFRAGNMLISVRELDAIAVLDPRTETIVWAAKGSWSRQHEPTVLASGNILLFDNVGHRGHSCVLEIDPVSLESIWEYADGPQTPLFSETCGAGRRLANGNTLIVESDNGRALEVTPDTRIVWEYYNPHRAGEERELIAAIPDMEILPDEAYPVWLSDR
ncbi:arylsulfotransferase family protein [bacterium]|nr:arylsulfotransferase family protein [bacterium]MBU1073990.1 arylsulfotransferase family protein [bacterium]MBU1676696.1 arylsulfotransferase family protein [bacterium]